MAKKNSGKVVQMLSPENYIRTMARTLPLYECWINPDWKEVKQAGCIISRKHNNGNITYCFYLVDLLCLGVKHTHFVFNEPVSHYKDFLAQAEEDISLELVDYELVHNVIHAGIEFAEEYEFKPYKDFTKVIQYFLEEDNDDIEEDYSDDDFDDQEEVYTQNMFEENREIFINLYNGLRDSDEPNDLIRLTKVTDALFLKITDNILVGQYYDELFGRLSIHVEAEEIVKELLGVKRETEINNELNELFMSVFMNIHRNLKKAREGLELFRREAEGIPAIAFLELLLLQKESSDKYAETLQKYATIYPDYSLINLIWLNHIYASVNVPDEIASKTFNLDTLFPGRDSLHFLEIFYYLMFISNVVTYEDNADQMEAFYQVLDEFDLPEEISKIVENSFSFARIEYLVEYFNIEIES